MNCDVVVIDDVMFDVDDCWNWIGMCGDCLCEWLNDCLCCLNCLVYVLYVVKLFECLFDVVEMIDVMCWMSVFGIV